MDDVKGHSEQADPGGAAAVVSAEERLAVFIEAVTEYAIFLLDPDGRVMTWNAGAKRIKGYDADEIVGRHFSVFYPADDVAGGKPERELADALRTGSCRDEGWRVRKDGTRFWANVVITAIRNEAGDLVGFAKVTRDDTDRRAAEEQVRHLELLTDRERIANALHRDLVHRIFEAGLLMQNASKLVVDPVAVAKINEAVDLMDEALRVMRAIVLDLEVPQA